MVGVERGPVYGMLSWFDRRGKFTVKTTYSEAEYYSLLLDISFTDGSRLVRTWKKE